MQDNHSWMGPSRTRRVIGIINDDWHQIGFSDGMYTRPDPEDFRRVYVNGQGGSITRFDPVTGASIGIRPSPPEGERYRWDWTSPILICPHDHLTVYTGGNRLFISRDGGDSWERTEDLTRQSDRDTMPIMGVAPSRQSLSGNDGTSSFGEITTIDESPLQAGLLWVGTDDGNVQVSEDGGSTWRLVSPNVQGIPDGTYVSRVEASHAVRGRAYVSFDAHRDGDLQPYLFVTQDMGRTWQPISGGLPDEGSVNVVVEYHRDPDLLFAGTEHGLFFSNAAGAHWSPLRNGLPTAPVDDLVIHPRDDDLVVGTHGRSIWILEDIAPLAALDASTARSALHLFPIRSPMQWQKWKATSYRGHGAYAAPQPADGAIITYWLADDAPDGVEVEITAADGRVVNSLTGPGSAGLQRVVWRLDFLVGGGRGGRGMGRAVPNMTPWLEETLAARGPFVLPGTYTVRVRGGGRQAVGQVTVRPDPDDPLTEAERQRRWTFITTVDDRLSTLGEREAGLRELEAAIQTARDAAARAERAPEGLVADLDRLREQGRTWLRDMAGGLSRRLSGLLSPFSASAARQGTIGAPTADMWTALEEAGAAVDEALGGVDAWMRDEVGPLDARLRSAGLPGLIAPLAQAGRRGRPYGR
jgi:hypothetical protein